VSAVEPLDAGVYREVVRRALAEDLGWGDTTTQALVGAETRATGVLSARAEIVLAGLDVAVEAFRQLDPALAVDASRRDGDRCRTGDVIATMTGLASALLTGERTALNLLRHLSGIASVTRWLVDAGGGRVRISDTRKTTPLLRALEKYAVRVGGGVNGRSTLDQGLVLKANHARLAGGVQAAVARLRSLQPAVPIEVECATAADADEALGAGAAIILFTGTSVDDLRYVMRRCAGLARLQVSGAIPVDRVTELAAAGVEVVKVGSITEAAPAADIILDLQPV
jgi:nicotinate-nucleotide pyrophosphorylase (carboxylating)